MKSNTSPFWSIAPLLCSLFCLLSLSELAAQGAVRTQTDPARTALIAAARRYLGVPYVYGAMSPQAFDCSGFVRFVYQNTAGITVPRSTRDYSAAGTPVSLKDALPGDVLVFDTVGGRPSHVGIFLGNDQFIHAASAGVQTGVIITSVYDRYWQPRLIFLRRFLPQPAVAAAPPASGTQAASGGAGAAASSSTPAPTSSAAAQTKPGTTVAVPAATAPSAPATGPDTGLLSAAASAPTPAAAPERVIAEIGFDIPAQRTAYTDPIPTSKGTELAFTVTNQSGKAGRFVVIFYKIEQDLSQSREIHRELVEMKEGQAYSLPPYRFTESGRYRLIVKDNWNNQLLERSFRVLD